MAPGADGQSLLEPRTFDPAVLLESRQNGDAQTAKSEQTAHLGGGDEIDHSHANPTAPSTLSSFLNGQLAQQAPPPPTIAFMSLSEQNKLTDLVMERTMGAFLEARDKERKATAKRGEVIHRELHGEAQGRPPVKPKGPGTQAE